MLSVTLRVVEDQGTINRRFYEALINKLAGRFNKVEGSLIQLFLMYFDQIIKASFTYNSLIKGKLSADFGFYMGSEEKYVLPIIDEWKTQVRMERIRLSQKAGGVYGSMTLKAIDRDLLKVMTISDGTFGAYYFSYNESGKIQYLIPWLEWLLRGGDNIVPNFVITTEHAERGRSKKAVMKKEEGGRWVVDPAFAGTVNKNWITDVLNEVKVKMKKDLIEMIKTQ